MRSEAVTGFWRAVSPFAVALQVAANPPSPGHRACTGRPLRQGTETAKQSHLGGPAVPLSPGVSLSMSTGWETGLSPSPSVRTPVKKKPLSDGDPRFVLGPAVLAVPVGVSAQ